MSDKSLPGRQTEIEHLSNLFGAASQWTIPSLHIYGHSSCGKTATLNHVLQSKSCPHVTVNCIECYASSLLFDEVLFGITGERGKCDNINSFVRQLKYVLKKSNDCVTNYIVFDKAEYLRDHDENLIPSLVNLQELTNCNVCSIFVSELPWDKFYTGVGIREPYSYFFKDYSKDELVEILCHLRPSDIDYEFYRQYINVLLAVFALVCRNLCELRHLANVNYELYCKPIREGKAKAEDKHRLWKNIEPRLRVALQTLYMREVSSDEWEASHALSRDATSDDIIGDHSCDKLDKKKAVAVVKKIVELPFYSKFLLISAYIASYNPQASDRRFFSKNAGRMKRSARTKPDDKKNCHLHGPRAFPIDRLMAIFYSIIDGKVAPTANLFSQISSLVSLHLLTQTGRDDDIDCPKYKCVTSLDTITAISRTVGFDVVRYLYDFI